MRRGFDGLALLVQEQLKRDPHSGQLFVFRGAHCRRRCVSVAGMTRRSDSLPTTLATARAAIAAQREALAAVEKRAEAGAAATENEARPTRGKARDVSTLADWIGAASATLMPPGRGDPRPARSRRSASMPMTPPCRCWAKGKCRTGRLWTYVRDDCPFAGTAAPAAAFFYSPDRSGRSNIVVSTSQSQRQLSLISADLE
jgi:transposase